MDPIITSNVFLGNIDIYIRIPFLYITDLARSISTLLFVLIEYYESSYQEVGPHKLLLRLIIITLL